MISSQSDYIDVVLKDSVEQAVRSYRQLGISGAAIYCHNHHYSKTDYNKPIESATVLSMRRRPPHPIPDGMQADLGESDRSRVDIGIHFIDDGDLAYLLVEPNPETGDIEISGWYCSAECIEDVSWPSEDHIAVEVEIHCDNPPDVRRMDVQPTVKGIEGVHLTESPQRRISEFG